MNSKQWLQVMFSHLQYFLIITGMLITCLMYGLHFNQIMNMHRQANKKTDFTAYLTWCIGLASINTAALQYIYCNVAIIIILNVV